MTQKRYQYYSPTGTQWTPWFHYTGNNRPKYQLGRKLPNEYR